MTETVVSEPKTTKVQPRAVTLAPSRTPKPCLEAGEEDGVLPPRRTHLRVRALPLLSG